MRFEQVAIEHIAYELPALAMSSTAIEKALSPLYERVGITPGWLEEITGIRERRVWEEDVRPSDVATRAAKKAIEQTGIDPAEIDVLVSCSVCRDYLEPSVACLVHGNLGLKPSCLNFDIGNACLGFLTGMQVVANLIETGQVRSGMIVAGESSRQVLQSTINLLIKPESTSASWRDHMATLTLGSGAVAMVMRRLDDSRSGHRYLGGLSRAATQHSRLCVGTESWMTTDPAKLLKEGVALAKRTWTEAIQTQGWDPARCAELAMHQVGKANHDAVLRTVGFPAERALRIYPQLGNVGAAGAPLTLALAAEQGRLRSGDLTAMFGIGSGLNVSLVRVIW